MPDIRTLHTRALTGHQLVERGHDMMTRSDADSGNSPTEDEWFALLKDMDAFLQSVPA